MRSRVTNISCLEYATDQLQTIDGLRIIGTAAKKAGVLSFLLGEIHPYDTGAILDRLGIAVSHGPTTVPSH